MPETSKIASALIYALMLASAWFFIAYLPKTFDGIFSTGPQAEFAGFSYIGIFVAGILAIGIIMGKLFPKFTKKYAGWISIAFLVLLVAPAFFGHAPLTFALAATLFYLGAFAGMALASGMFGVRFGFGYIVFAAMPLAISIAQALLGIMPLGMAAYIAMGTLALSAIFVNEKQASSYLKRNVGEPVFLAFGPVAVFLGVAISKVSQGDIDPYGLLAFASIGFPSAGMMMLFLMAANNFINNGKQEPNSKLIIATVIVFFIVLVIFAFILPMEMHAINATTTPAGYNRPI